MMGPVVGEAVCLVSNVGKNTSSMSQPILLNLQRVGPGHADLIYYIFVQRVGF